MKITVFGGSGFLGSHVCDKLSDKGYDVTIFDLRHSPWLHSDQKMIVGNILYEEEVIKAVEDAQVVFNFAGIADIGEANGRPVDTARYNILGNAIILEACRNAGVKRFIFASSVYVYSKSGGFYRCSKQACEMYIECFNENYGLEYTTLRYGSLYGPRANERNAIYRFVSEALKNKKITYYGSPNALREYIHVEDAARSSVDILKPEYANKHIVLTGHQTMKVSNVLKMIAEMLGEEVEFDFQDDPNHVHYEITPYSFNPKVGYKLTPSLHTDFGQGVLKIIEEFYKSAHKEMQQTHGVLIKE